MSKKVLNTNKNINKNLREQKFASSDEKKPTEFLQMNENIHRSFRGKNGTKPIQFPLKSTTNRNDLI